MFNAGPGNLPSICIKRLQGCAHEESAPNDMKKQSALIYRSLEGPKGRMGLCRTRAGAMAAVKRCECDVLKTPSMRRVAHLQVVHCDCGRLNH